MGTPESTGFTIDFTEKAKPQKQTEPRGRNAERDLLSQHETRPEKESEPIS
jgi:hypothetical protein